MFGSRTRGRKAAVLVAAMVLLGVVGLAVTAGVRAAADHPAAGTATLTVTVGTALSFTASTSEVQPGDNVTLVLVQTSTVVHTFTLLDAPNFQFNWSSSGSGTDSLSHIDGFLAAHPPLVNYTFPDSPNSFTMHFIAPAFGLYEYLCLEPGHFAGGMWGILGSGETGGGGSTASTGPGAPVFIIAGTIAGLVVLSIVLAFYVGRRRGAVHEMPPERLGYPEPTGPASPASPPPGGRP